MDRTKAARYTRREFSRRALALPATVVLGRQLDARALTAALQAGRVNSRINGVQIGAITYSFRAITDAAAIVRAMASIGLGEVELMSNHAEALAGAPTGRGAAGTLDAWRASSTPATWAPVRRTLEDAGLQLKLLCYNMNVRTTDDAAIEYGFAMAKALGVEAITTSTQVSMAKRVAPFADKHRIPVAYHGHSNISDPDEVATPESFATCLSYSRYHMINLDIGHFTAGGFDAVAFLRANHARITNLHLKDRKKPASGGANLAWGQGDTPIKEVLQMLRKEKWDIPANIEFEYPGDPLVEIPKCLQFCRDALA